MGQAVHATSLSLKQFPNKVLQRKVFSCLHQPLKNLELLYYTTSDVTKNLAIFWSVVIANVSILCPVSTFVSREALFSDS